MKDIFKLYYYEIVKNRKLFFINLIIAIMYIFFHLYLAFDIGKQSIGISEINDVLTNFLQNNSTPEKLNNFLIDFSSSSINLAWTMRDFQYVFIYLTLFLSILMSFRIVSRDLSKNTMEYFSYVCLPIKTYKIKISKIMTGLTLYISTSLLINFSLIIVNLILSICFKQIYSHSFADNLYLMMAVLDPDFPSIMFFTFGYVLTCIIGIQTVTSILYMDYEKRGILKKLVYPIVLFFSMIFMGFLLIYLIFNKLNSETLMISNLYFSIIIFIVISVGLFILDCRMTNKRLRGGI